ncbi:MAG: hypothetical protein XFASWVDF_000712 [Candidatus Fervidibacter sp.]
MAAVFPSWLPFFPSWLIATPTSPLFFLSPVAICQSLPFSVVADSHSNKEGQPDALFAFAGKPTLPPTFIQPSVGAAISRENGNVRCDGWRLFKA